MGHLRVLYQERGHKADTPALTPPPHFLKVMEDTPPPKQIYSYTHQVIGAGTHPEKESEFPQITQSQG